ncbi:ArsR/SmtB family transcription factor [Shumkonia mesophila]|uniref:ArsR/SmtB family transcription factor n=1 Tax=Shumkonia mesophila TaxID=2838854 RepID=UPI00293505AE|nr:metalloregulator ArsR/SmtB family transcription factor [Shumkonia mesophila]
MVDRIAGTSADAVVRALRAAAEPTRLRILALCARGELTVSELVHVLGQSQPRVSRHLRLLVDGGLMERFREGSWVFHRVVHDGPMAGMVRTLLDGLDPADAGLAPDLARLGEVKEERARAAEAYFRRNAAEWDRLRGLHVDDGEVERRIVDLLPDARLGTLLDVGTGTARILELLAPRLDRGEGIDLSREMLAVARANLERAGLGQCAVRRADMYDLPFQAGAFDVVTIHQVLHFADEPGRVIAESARVLKAGGRMLVVDFAPHEVESLRDEHAHRRLGFADTEVEAWFRAAGLRTAARQHLSGDPLTVGIWLAGKRPAAERTLEEVN